MGSGGEVTLDFKMARARLVEHLSTEIGDQRVLTAMADIPRECFVPESGCHLAYQDKPLPIGLGQTISQPLIVALMTEALALTGNEKVLEIGTGSGYQVAILAELARKVITVERHLTLAQAAGKVLERLGYNNIEQHPAGKTLGWPEEAPYDAIIATAAAPRAPEGLLDQLAIGGRLVIPVGSRYEQELYKITRGRRKNRIEHLGGCRFVSLIGEGAWQEE